MFQQEPDNKFSDSSFSYPSDDNNESMPGLIPQADLHYDSDDSDDDDDFPDLLPRA